MGRKLDKADTENVRLVAHYLKKHNQLQYARDMYKKVGDFKAVVLIYVDAGEWKEAFSLVEKNPEYREHVRATRLELCRLLKIGNGELQLFLPVGFMNCKMLPFPIPVPIPDKLL